MVRTRLIGFSSTPALRGAKADPRSLRRTRWRHQLTDGVEDNFELCIIPTLECREFPRKGLVGRQKSSEPYEGSHDLDVHLNGTVRAQDALRA